MRAIVALILLGSPGLAAPVPKELKKSDHARIVGTWLEIGSSMNGGANQPGSGDRRRFDADGTATITRKDGTLIKGIRFTLGESVQPRTFEWIAPWGTWTGTYEFDGDTLTTHLSSTKGFGVEMHKYKRADSAK